MAGQQRRQALARGGQAAVDGAVVVGRLGGALAAALRHRHQVATEIAAVDTAHIARQQCGAGLGVVPVQEVAAVALQGVERAQGGLQALQQVLGADPAEPARAGRAQQVQADVGGRGAVGQLVLRRGLQVVRWQVAIVGADAALEEAPAVAGDGGQAGLLGRRQGLLGTGRRRPAGPPAQHRGAGPQRAQPQRQAGVGGATGQQPGQQAGGQQRLAPMRPQYRRQRPGRRRLGGGGGGPLKQLAVADGHAPQGPGDRVSRQQGLGQQLGQVPGAATEGPAQPGAGLAVEMLQRNVVAAGRQPGHCAQQRPGGEARHHQRQRQPGRDQRGRAGRDQGQHQQGQAGRRHQRAAQVVEHLPAVDGPHRIAPPLQQEGQQLPVATGPAVQAGGGHVGMRGGVLDHGDVGGHRTARQRALQQIVAEHLAIGQALAQHRMHRLHLQQALAAEAAFAEQVLVDLGAGRAVGVDAALAGKQPVVGRLLGMRGQRRGHARLQDAVAVRHPAPAGIEQRPVLRVGGDGHQLTQPAGWQLAVAVERDQVGRGAGQPRQLAQGHEARRRGAGGCGRRRGLGQRGHQQLKLAALALPADPGLFALAVLARPVQQDEARRGARRHRVALVQGLERAAGLVQRRGVGGAVFGGGIGPVTEQRKLRAGLGVGQVMQVQAVHQPLDGGGRAQHRRDGHQHPVLGRDALAQRQPRQMPGLGRFTDQAVDHRHHRLRRRQQHQQRRQRGPAGGPGQGCRQAGQRPGQQRAGAQRQRAQVGGQGQPLGQAAALPGPVLLQAQARRQHRPATALQPVGGHTGARVGVAGVRRLHQRQQRLRHRRFALAAAAGQGLDAVQGLVAGEGVLGTEHRRLQHQAHQGAAALDDGGPVGRADGAQGMDGIADAEVVGGLVGDLLGLGGGQLRQGLLQPGLHLGGVADAPALQALRQLRQELGAHAAGLHQRVQCHQVGQGVGIELVAAQIGHLARGLVGGHPLGQAAQVLDQHHPQRGRQGPHLAQRQLAGLLVGHQVVHQQVFIEGRIGVGDEGPGHAIDAWQAGQRRVLQHRQGAKVALGQAVADRLELGLDEVEVVQQPFSGRADVVAAGGLRADVALGQAQHRQVVAQPGEEHRGARPRCRGAVGLAQASSMLGKALQAKDLRPDRRLGRAVGAAQHVQQQRRGLGQQALQRVSRHWTRPPSLRPRPAWPAGPVR